MMHCSLVLSVVLVCLTVACNGQFKILGLLDSKGEVNSEKVESIRSLDDVAESIDAIKINDEEAVKASLEKSDGGKDNVNFIKPFESFTKELKKDLIVEAASEAAIKQNDVLVQDNTKSGYESGEDVVVEIISDDSVAPILESSTMSTTTTIATKSYRKTLRPNIRKFAYIEARSFHHPDSPNHVTPSSRWNNYLIKDLKYRNKYKSKCRCERIWNCPKIQISIQRCEPDYFMCCF